MLVLSPEVDLLPHIGQPNDRIPWVIMPHPTQAEQYLLMRQSEADQIHQDSCSGSWRMDQDGRTHCRARRPVHTTDHPGRTRRFDPVYCRGHSGRFDYLRLADHRDRQSTAAIGQRSRQDPLWLKQQA